MRPLTLKQQRFAIEYVLCQNGAKAVRRAGYKVKYARQKAYKMLQESPGVRAEIERIKWLIKDSDDPVATLKAHFGSKWQPKPGQDEAGFVYLLRAGNFRRVKIGKTVDLEQRLRQLKKVNLMDVQLVCAIETNNIIALERTLHEKYAACRIRDEVFDLGDEQIREIIETYDTIHEQTTGFHQ